MRARVARKGHPHTLIRTYRHLRWGLAFLLACVVVAFPMLVAPIGDDGWRGFNPPQCTHASDVQQGFCVVVPFVPTQLPRLLRNLKTWTEQRRQPCGGLGSSQLPVNLIFYYNRDVASLWESTAHQIASILRSDGRSMHPCFQHTLLATANLSPEQDQYNRTLHRFSGPNNMFFLLMQQAHEGFGTMWTLDGDVVPAPRCPWVFLMEPDVVPIRPGWVHAISEEVYIASYARNWMRGSGYRGSDRLPRDLLGHINGNALYHTEDTGFAKFLASVRDWLGSENRVPFDYAIYRLLWDLRYFDVNRHLFPRFAFSEVIVNHGDSPVVEDEVRALFPHTFFVHGRWLLHEAEGRSQLWTANILNILKVIQIEVRLFHRSILHEASSERCIDVSMCTDIADRCDKGLTMLKGLVPKLKPLVVRGLWREEADTYATELDTFLHQVGHIYEGIVHLLPTLRYSLGKQLLDRTEVLYDSIDELAARFNKKVAQPKLAPPHLPGDGSDVSLGDEQAPEWCHVDPVRQATITSQFSLVVGVPSGTTVDSIHETVEHYAAMSSIHTIYVQWPPFFSQSLQDMKGLLHVEHENVNTYRANIEVLDVPNFSRNLPFRPPHGVQTEAVAIVNAGVRVPFSGISAIFDAWREIPDHTLGTARAMHRCRAAWGTTDDLCSVDVTSGNGKGGSPYSWLQRQFFLLPLSAFHLYSCTAPSRARSLVDRYDDCEDLALSFALQAYSDAHPFLVELDSGNALSGPNSKRNQQRLEACLRELRSIYGRIPLRQTSLRISA